MEKQKNVVLLSSGISEKFQSENNLFLIVFLKSIFGIFLHTQSEQNWMHFRP